MQIPKKWVAEIQNPWVRLAWAILFRAVADLYTSTHRDSAAIYLRSRRAGALMDCLGVEQPALLAAHGLASF